MRIRAVRREAGLTQQGLATAVEVSRQTIIAMETGDYAPSVYLAIKVARRSARRSSGCGPTGGVTRSSDRPRT